MTCLRRILLPTIAYLFFLVSCKAPAKPIQKIYIGADKNVRIITVDGEINGPPKKYPSLTAKDSSDLKHLYISIKRLYKEERKSQKHESDKAYQSFLVPRSSKPLAIKISSDSIQKTIYLHAYKNYGRFLNMRYVFRAADTSNAFAFKRWIYPRKTIINLDDDKFRLTRFPIEKKGSFNVTMSAGLQIFNLTTDIGKYSSAGILGIEAGIDYFYKRNKFLSMSLGAATDLIPLPIEYFDIGYIERGSVIYTSVRDNFIVGKFNFGYGLSLSRLYWTGIPHGDSSLPYRRVRTTGVGFSLSANYYLKRNIKFGVLYQPNVFNINQGMGFSYQHLIKIGCTINLGRRNQARN